MFVHEASKRDVARDKDQNRRRVTESKIEKFEVLSGIPTPDNVGLETLYGPIRKHNDLIDCTLLYALGEGIVDFLVTQDMDLQKRAAAVGLGSRVFTVEEAVEWLRQTYEPKSVALPYIEERYCYELAKDDPIFDTLRTDYLDFDTWFRDKCLGERRKCWRLAVAGETAGVVIWKDEPLSETNATLPASKVLKLCTFKVSEKYRGEKFGELLLKQALWWAQRNHFEATYVTTFPHHVMLISLLEEYGFRLTRTMESGELQYEKSLGSGPVTDVGDALRLDREHYPRFVDDARVRVLCVPIRPCYHRMLFPEAYEPRQPTLFGASHDRRTPGNTIRKVYLCRSTVKKMSAGDVLLFYMSKDEDYIHSQSMATVGVVVEWTETADVDEVFRLTAKRAAYSDEDLRSMLTEKATPLKVIDFLLVGHFDTPLHCGDLTSMGIFKRPPQSIAEVARSAYAALDVYRRLGF